MFAPSAYDIGAREDTDILYITKAGFLQLLDPIPAINLAVLKLK